MELRPYQQRSFSDAIKYLDGSYNKPVVIVAPTGSGKTISIAFIAEEILKRGGKVVITSPSEELLTQNSKKYLEYSGTEVSFYSASVGKKDIGDITFATIGSLKGKGSEFKEAGVTHVLADECHYKITPKDESIMKEFFKALSPQKSIGLTASPFYLKSTKTGSELVMLNRSFPRIFEKIIHITQIDELVSNGYWANLDYVVYPFDSSALELNKGGTEFTEESVRLANDVQGVNNRMYLQAKDLISKGSQSIIIFCDSVETAIKMSDHLPSAKCIHAKTPKKERRQFIEDFKEGNLKILTCVSTLVMGFDHSEIDHILDGSSTMSLALYYQKLGRGVRRSESKDKCAIHDFCGNYHRFGRIEDLTIEYYGNYGWGVFSGDRLLTGVPLQGLNIYKKDLDRIQWEKPESKMKLWFGQKYKDKLVHQIPYNIRDFWLKKWDFTSDKMIDLKVEMERLNRIEALNKLTTKKRAN